MVGNLARLASKRTWCALIAFVFVLSTISSNVLALDNKFDELFYQQNDILYYNPDCSTSADTQAGIGSVGIPSYKNPIINKEAPDPSVTQDEDGLLHMYVSGLRHYTSKDGAHWSGGGEANVSGAPGGKSADAWAPDIAKVNDMYVLSWARPSGGILYATGSKAGGPFKYTGELSNRGIDPQVFADSGKYYLYSASSNNILVSELGASGKKLKAGPAHSVLDRMDVKNEKWTVEAPWVINRNGTYYLFYSTGKWNGGSGFNRDDYDLRVAKASSPTKKFNRKGSPTLTKNSKFTGPGAATTFSDKSGQDWLIYHARPNGGNDRTPMLDRITYVSGWPVINGGNGPSTGTQDGSGDESSGGVSGGTIRVGSYNAAGATMQKGGLGGLKKAQDHLNAGMAVEDSNNATIVTLQEVAANVKAPSGWSMFKAPFGDRTVAIAWKTNVWSLKEKDVLSVNNSVEGRFPGIPDAYKYPFATFADKNGNTVTVMSAHLVSSLRDGSQRKEQAQNVQKKVLELQASGKHVILGGDFNYKKQSALFDVMKPLTPANPNNTILDNIFGSAGVSFNSWKKVSDTRSFTDHNLIFTNAVVSGSSFNTTTSACTCPAPGTSTTSAALRGEGLEAIFNYFVDKGLSGVQAAGIVGNIVQESGGNPLNAQKGPDTKDPSQFTTKGHAWGIIQWDPGNKIIPLAKAAGADGPIYELSTQLDIVWAHLHNKPPITKGDFNLDAYKAITDVNKATDYFEYHIEGPDPAKANMTNRYAKAKLALDQYGGGSSSTSVASATTTETQDCGSAGAGAVAGNIVETAINYAWPNRDVNPATKLKPTYAAAIAKAKSAGKYTGDNCYGGGVDCGAFITRVMQDSGVDPNYGGGGNTGVQLQYLQSHPDLYTEVHPSSTADLQPGDIAIQSNSSRHHTYMYVGKQNGFDSTIASSSQCEHAPWAGLDKPADPGFHWFRYTGSGTDTDV